MWPIVKFTNSDVKFKLVPICTTESAKLEARSVFFAQNYGQPYKRCVVKFHCYLSLFSRNPTADDNAFWVLSGLTAGVPIQLDSLPLSLSLSLSLRYREFFHLSSSAHFIWQNWLSSSDSLLSEGEIFNYSDIPILWRCWGMAKVSEIITTNMLSWGNSSSQMQPRSSFSSSECVLPPFEVDSTVRCYQATRRLSLATLFVRKSHKEIVYMVKNCSW